MMFGPGSSVVELLELGGWDVAEFAVQAAVVEPVDPGERRQFDVVGVAPGALAADEFGLVEPVHRLGEGVVVAVTDRPDRGQSVDLGEAFGVRDRGVLGEFKRWSQHL